MNNKDVPITTVLRYIKRERDEYKRKLDLLVPYTKRLEEKVKMYEASLEDDVDLSAISVSQLRRNFKDLKRINSELREGIKNSDAYKSLEHERTKFVEEIRYWRRRYSELKQELEMPKKGS